MDEGVEDIGWENPEPGNLVGQAGGAVATVGGEGKLAFVGAQICAWFGGKDKDSSTPKPPVLGMEPRALHILGKYRQLYPSPRQ